METIQSKFLSLSKSDALKSFYVFLLSTIVSLVGDAIMQEINSGSYSLSSIHWREIGAAILVAVVAYLKKQFFTNSNGEIFKNEAK